MSLLVDQRIQALVKMVKVVMVVMTTMAEELGCVHPRGFLLGGGINRY